MGWAAPLCSETPGEEGTEHVPLENVLLFGMVANLLQDTLTHGHDQSKARGWL